MNVSSIFEASSTTPLSSRTRSRTTVLGWDAMAHRPAGIAGPVVPAYHDYSPFYKIVSSLVTRARHPAKRVQSNWVMAAS
jgi:hypothetical protein